MEMIFKVLLALGVFLLIGVLLFGALYEPKERKA